MIQLGDKEFRQLVSDAIDAVPALYQKHLQNVAFIVEDEPTLEQRQKLNLYRGELLFGLYEGIPLPSRQGATKLLPDKITIFKNPALIYSNSFEELRQHVHHTVWHEVAHYYGLNHKRIHELERHLKKQVDPNT
ncbi:MAG TPA: metallopeptidase family protein [Candidatus Saccharimonadales bacterium]|nr:metallopeptidase family protein [Candidatus Saccharimonadales bacterium]